jgi:uncharacterized protein YyaL (SSP411 family)
MVEKRDIDKALVDDIVRKLASSDLSVEKAPYLAIITLLSFAQKTGNLKLRDAALIALDSVSKNTKASLVDSALLLRANLYAFVVSREARYLGAAKQMMESCRERFSINTLSFREGSLAVSVFFEAFRLVNDEKSKACAKKGLDSLLSRVSGDKAVDALDAVSLAAACIDAYETVFDPKYRSAAEGLMKSLDIPVSADFVLKVYAADSLIRLGEHTADEKLKERAKGLLMSVSVERDLCVADSAVFALALDRLLSGFELHIITERSKFALSPMLAHINRLIVPKSVIVLDNKEDVGLIKKLGYSPSEKTVVFVCYGGACRPPAFDADKLGKILSSIIKL